MTPGDIRLLHVESSTKCNAWCPACPRNKSGFGLIDGLIETDLSVDRFNQVIVQLPALEIVQLCGNLGDPIAGSNFLELVDICIDKKLKLQIHTNAGLRSKSWWTSLGEKLKDVPHDVWFGIDGIGSVHEIYRQGTDYNKVIENASAFIDAGGTATWQFIPYAHNQHQVMQALKTSQELKFKNFKLVKLFRKERVQVKHWKTGEPFELEIADKLAPLIKKDNAKSQSEPESCMHLSIPSVYLDVNGHLSWCCYRYKEYEDTVEQLLNKSLDLSNQHCIKNC